MACDKSTNVLKMVMWGLVIISYIAGSVTMINKIDEKAVRAFEGTKINRDIVGDVIDVQNEHNTQLRLHQQMIDANKGFNKDLKESIGEFKESTAQLREIVIVLNEQVSRLRKEMNQRED